MTNKEKHAILDQIEALIEDLRDNDTHYADEGKVVWPPNNEMSHRDALATLFDIEDCSLDLTLYNETGNQLTDEWTVTLSGTQLYPNSPGHYGRKSLKAMIGEELQLYIDDGNQDCQPARLLRRLLDAFETP